MKKMIACIIFYLCIQSSFGQNISIIFVSPAPRGTSIQLEDSILSIAVTVISTYTIASVSANVSGRQTSLTFDIATGRYEESLTCQGYRKTL